jgi:uncharacterized membrane protein
VQTVFQGTTLRGLLLEAYGFSVQAKIALIGAIGAFVLAALMAVLVVLGFLPARRTSQAEEIFVAKDHRSATRPDLAFASCPIADKR